MRKSRRDYKQEVATDPFELVLDEAPEGHRGFVVFSPPDGWATEDALNAEQLSPVDRLRAMLSEEDWEPFWAEQRRAPIAETNALLADVMKHYGVDSGKAVS